MPVGLSIRSLPARGKSREQRLRRLVLNHEMLEVIREAMLDEAPRQHNGGSIRLTVIVSDDALVVVKRYRFRRRHGMKT